MRKSSRLLLYLGTLCGLFLLTSIDAVVRTHPPGDRIERMQAQVRSLELTDLSLFTEARYTRHLSQADFHTPFQDHPLALEHFPSGSLVTPPDTLGNRP